MERAPKRSNIDKIDSNTQFSSDVEIQETNLLVESEDIKPITVKKTKKVKFNITINVDPDFRPGRCDLCPIHTVAYRKNGPYIAEPVAVCPLEYTQTTCPVEA